MLNVYRQLAVLDQLYKIYNQYIDTLDIACKKFCADCCTCNVTMTTLEAYKIISALDLDSRQTMLEKLNQQMEKQRFTPKITTNQLADICLSDDDPPEEVIDPSWGPCPLLTDNACPVYDLMPAPSMTSGHSAAGAWFQNSDARILVPLKSMNSPSPSTMYFCNILNILTRTVFPETFQMCCPTRSSMNPQIQVPKS